MVCGVLTAVIIIFASKLISKCLSVTVFAFIRKKEDKMDSSLIEKDQVDKSSLTLTDSTQILDFSCDDGQRLDVVSKDVIVKSGGGTHTQGSSLIKLRNIVDYNWEHKLYIGQLLAVHISGDFLAYAVKVVAPGSSSGTGMVRVVQRSTEKRALLKGMQGLIQDLSFAFITQQVLLACIDNTSSFYIYELYSQSDTIVSKLLFSVNGNNSSTTHRIVWCSYVPEEGEGEMEEEEDPSKFLVSTSGSKAYIWNISQMMNKHGVGPHHLSHLAEPCNTVDHHTQDILEVTFSPDGSALATASRDGLVKFFQPSLLQVYDHNEKIKCIHQWSPHADKPVSSLFFLDSRTTSSSDQFWKCVVTGYDNVVKIWSCKDWSCLQTITFTSSPLLKLGLSRCAEQMLVSDITMRVLYVLELTPNTSTSVCRCTSITHFYLPFPFLSFADVHIGRKIFKCPSNCDDPYHSVTIDDEENDSPVDEDHILELDDMDIEGVMEEGGGSRRVKKDGCSVCKVLHMYLVQPKSLQHASITLPDYPISNTNNLPPPDLSLISPLIEPVQPEIPTLENGEGVVASETTEVSVPPAGPSPQHSINTILAHQSQQLKNILMRPNNAIPPPAPQILPAPPLPHTLNLMTPDAFNSPPKRDPADQKEAIAESTLQAAKPTTTTPKEVYSTVKYTASGGSSPSREVQEILSVKGSDYYEEDMDEDEDIPIVPCPEATPLKNDNADEDVKLNGVWPSINMDKINEANQRKATSDSLNNSFSNKSANLMDINVNNMNGDCAPIIPLTTNTDNQSLYEVTAFMRQLTLMMAEQQKELAFLRSEVSNLRHNNVNSAEEIRQSVESALNRHTTSMKQTMDGVLAGRAEAERLQRDSLLSGVSQIVGVRLGEKLAASVAHEARTTLLPEIHNILEPIVKALLTDLARSLSTTDHLLAENIQKLVNSKSVIEGLGSSIAQVVSESSQQAFKVAVQSNLVPAMERAVSQMLKQINTTFAAGVKEYMMSFENCTKRSIEQTNKINDTCNQLNNIIIQLDKILKQQTKESIANANSENVIKTQATKELQNALSKSLQSALDTQVLKLRDIVKEQVNAGMSAHVAHLEDSVLHAVRSGAQTPAPMVVDMQQQIDQSLQKGELNGAFQMALSASDLRLVVHCCKGVESTKLSQKPCPLQQHVLLSLIQQLGADMTSDTKLKYTFLEEAVMNLDRNNPVTKEHMPAVLSQLKKFLSNFLSSNPGFESSRNMRVLLMAIDSLLYADS